MTQFLTQFLHKFLFLLLLLLPLLFLLHFQNGKYFIDNPPDKDKLIQVEVMDTIVIATEENKNPLRLVLCDADVASHISQPKAFADIFEGESYVQLCMSLLILSLRIIILNPSLCQIFSRVRVTNRLTAVAPLEVWLLSELRYFDQWSPAVNLIAPCSSLI